MTIDPFATSHFLSNARERGEAIPGGALGLGYNPVAGRMLARAVDDAQEQSLGGQSTKYRLTVVTRFDELLSALSVDASTSVGGFFWGGDARFSFARSVRTSTFSTYYVARVSVENMPIRLKDYQLRDEARLLLEQGNADDFLLRYGSEFIASIVTGGELAVVLAFESRNHYEATRLRAALSGNVGLFSAETDVASRIQRVQNMSSTRVEIYKRGGDPELPDSSTWDEALLKYPLEVTVEGGKRVDLSYETVSYKATVNRPVSPVPRDLLEAKQHLRRLGRLRSRVEQLVTDGGYVGAHPEQFVELPGFSAARLVENCTRISDSLAEGAEFLVERNQLPEGFDLAALNDQVDQLALPAWKDGARLPLLVDVYPSGSGAAEKRTFREDEELDQIFGIAIRSIDANPELVIRYRLSYFWMPNAVFGHQSPIVESSWQSNGTLTAATNHLGMRLFPATGLEAQLTGALAEYFSIEYDIRKGNGGWQSFRDGGAPIDRVVPMTGLRVRIIRR